jgi:hypothetical protein
VNARPASSSVGADLTTHAGSGKQHQNPGDEQCPRRRCGAVISATQKLSRQSAKPNKLRADATVGVVAFGLIVAPALPSASPPLHGSRADFFMGRAPISSERIGLVMVATSLRLIRKPLRCEGNRTVDDVSGGSRSRRVVRNVNRRWVYGGAVGTLIVITACGKTSTSTVTAPRADPQRLINANASRMGYDGPVGDERRSISRSASAAVTCSPTIVDSRAMSWAVRPPVEREEVRPLRCRAIVVGDKVEANAVGRPR